MVNVYIDPFSHVYLQDTLFQGDTEYNKDNVPSGLYYVREYCREQGVMLHTIDKWNPAVAKEKDLYVSFDHKFLPRKLYWKLKNNAYPIVDTSKFVKKILFQFEPPIVIPEIRYLVKRTVKIYDEVFFTWKTGVSGIRHFHTPLPVVSKGVLPEYWENEKRGFTMMINSNRKSLSKYRELLSERVRAVLAFAKTNDVHLYGFGWDKPPLFPYWFQGEAIRKVYKGSVQNKCSKLSEYTYAFAFENCQLPSYITDKIFNCLYVGTIPIYLGAPDIEDHIPKNCFIDMRDFKNYEELREFLKSQSKAEIRAYKENGRRFLESERYQPFTKEYFARTFTKTCRDATT